MWVQASMQPDTKDARVGILRARLNARTDSLVQETGNILQQLLHGRECVFRESQEVKVGRSECKGGIASSDT